MNESAFEWRSCCPALALDDVPPGKFVETVGEVSKIALGPPIGQADPPTPDRVTGWHEISHAIAAHLAGIHVSGIALIGCNPHAAYREAIPKGVARAVVALAGPAGGARAAGFLAPQCSREVCEAWARVNFPAGGACDTCQAMRAAIQHVGLDREAEAVALYRQAERLAHAIIWNSEVERVIRIASHELMRDGRMSGERFHQIAGDVIAPETIETYRKEMEKCWNF